MFVGGIFWLELSGFDGSVPGFSLGLLLPLSPTVPPLHTNETYSEFVPSAGWYVITQDPLGPGFPTHWGSPVPDDTPPMVIGSGVCQPSFCCFKGFTVME